MLEKSRVRGNLYTIISLKHLAKSIYHENPVHFFKLILGLRSAQLQLPETLPLPQQLPLHVGHDCSDLSSEDEESEWGDSTDSDSDG